MKATTVAGMVAGSVVGLALGAGLMMVPASMALSRRSTVSSPVRRSTATSAPTQPMVQSAAALPCPVSGSWHCMPWGTKYPSPITGLVRAEPSGLQMPVANLPQGMDWPL